MKSNFTIRPLCLWSSADRLLFVLSRWAEGYRILKEIQEAPFNTEEQRLHSELLSPVSKAEPSHSAEETHFGCFSSSSHFLAHDRGLRMNVGRKHCTPARLPFYHNHSAPRQAACQSHAPVYFFLPFPFEQTTRASDFKMLTLIPSETKATTSSAKFRDIDLRFPNWTLSSPQR